MKEGQGLAIETGKSLLTASQFREAGLANVMSMFSATGMSESERLEATYMLQRTIIEGYLSGVNIPGILKHREGIEGKLNLGFTDSHIPTRNAIQFDRNAWRSQPLPQRMGEFVQRLGARLSSRPNSASPPAARNAPRHFNEMARSGGMRAPRNVMAAHHLAQAVKNAVWAKSSGNVFQGLRGVQREAGVSAPQVQTATAYPRIGNPATSVALQDEQMGTTYQTRQEMIGGGMPAMQAMAMPARSGQASARTPGQSMAKMAAQMPAQGRPNRVILFTGGVTFTSEVNEAARNMDALGIKYDRISSLNGLDYSKYGAIFFAGGNAGPEWNAIAGNASELRSAINGGLNYVGNCAGAFLAGNWGNGLKLTNNLIDYSSQYGTTNASVPVKMWDGTTRYMSLLGGPGLENVVNNTPGARELASFSGGEAAMASFNYGQGHVILSAVHPMNSTSGDKDGDDDAYMQAIFKAIVQGTDPDGQVGPPTNGGPNGNTTTNNQTNNYSIPPAPTLSMGNVAVGGGNRGKAQSAPSRKTPVAGVLPEGIVQNSFASSISSIINRHTPMLAQISGNFVGGKGAG